MRSSFVAMVLMLAGCGTPSVNPHEPPPEAPDAPGSPRPRTDAQAAPVAGAPAEASAGEPAGEHHHDSVHGGIVHATADGHVEALMMPDGIMFYVSDSAQKPVPLDGYTGTAVVKGPDGVSSVPLMAMGDHLHAPVKLAQGQPASVVVTLTHDGKAESVSFETAAVGLQAHDHRSLHGGTVSMWGETHLEYAPAADTYRIWVTDAKRVPITAGVSGSLKDGTTVVPLTFEPATGLLSGAGKGAGTRPVMVDVKVGETSFSLAFAAVPAP